MQPPDTWYCYHCGTLNVTWVEVCPMCMRGSIYDDSSTYKKVKESKTVAEMNKLDTEISESAIYHGIDQAKLVHQASSSVDQEARLNHPEWHANDQATPNHEMTLGFSDSGYAPAAESILDKKNNANVFSSGQATEEVGPKFSDYGSSHGIADDTETGDSGSIYSVATTIATSAKERFITELVEDLAENILAGCTGHNIPVERICDTLPQLLKAFARSTGYLKESQSSGDIMVFISKNRTAITERLKGDFVAAPGKDKDSSMSFNEIFARWSFEEASDFAEEAESVSGRHNREQEKFVQPTPIDSFEGVKDFEELVLEEIDQQDSGDWDEPIKLPPYRRYVEESWAYRWLLSRIRRNMVLTSPLPNLMQDISDNIFNYFSHSEEVRKLSRSIVPMVCTAEFFLDWCPSEFLREQGYQQKPEEAIGKVITLTGSATDAQALTVEQYTHQTWPLTGIDVLESLKDALRNSKGTYSDSKIFRLKNGARVQTLLEDTVTHVIATGTLDTIAEIGEQLAWLGAAVRSTPNSTTLSSCVPLLRNLTVETFAKGPPIAKFRLDYKTIYPEIPDTAPLNGRCWHNLFYNPVLVEGYPLLSRSEASMGIEMSLDLAAVLMGVERIYQYDGVIVLKSFCAMLVATKKVTDIVVWHLLLNKTGKHMSFADVSQCGLIDSSLSRNGLAAFQPLRNVIGWCSTVSAFTGSPSANYNILWSQLQKPYQGCVFEKITVSGGQFINIGASFLIGKKDKPAFSRARSDYTEQLRWISKKHVILYDVTDRRAWMVDGVSALLHLVRASLLYNKNDGFAEKFLFNIDDLVEASGEGNGKRAAISVLTNVHNQSLKLHSRTEDSYEEETTKENGLTEVVRKKKITYYLLRDRVDHICHLLEQIIAYQSQMESQDGIGLKIRPSSRRRVEGFDFMDIATDEDPFWPRIATLGSEGAGWIDFTRALHAITLFGRGFGELFKPTDDARICSHWKTVPRGLDYLTICVADLEEILKKSGDTLSNPWRIVDDIRWHNPEMIFGPCKRKKKAQGQCCDRAQVLLPSNFPSLLAKQFRSPSHLEASGAVIFGRNSKLPLYWGDKGDPQHIGTSQTTITSASPLDSGIGSSISSPTSQPGTNQSSQASSSDNGGFLADRSGFFHLSRRKKQKVKPSI
ncbi:hypothetical protein DM02DRAFT_612609 [Periconia macrospinosa]|uniref:RanBP2-type domain-containing protein n=1 Tax=Periconia macrospinosa TaxID=97972 RepID=A0A2V1DXH0_9PLEO|nr:hypothetical protein DM02DRAFT_612609 [Periconia macrospinosa]